MHVPTDKHDTVNFTSLQIPPARFHLENCACGETAHVGAFQTILMGGAAKTWSL